MENGCASPDIMFLARLSVVLCALGGTVLGLSGCEASEAKAVGPMVCTLANNPVPIRAGVPGQPDLTGRTRLGKASYYAGSFADRVMANGRRMDPQGSNAASRTLPLGTVAKVTNLKTGQSAVVSIEDRGPYVDGRIVDLHRPPPAGSASPTRSVWPR